MDGEPSFFKRIVEQSMKAVQAAASFFKREAITSSETVQHTELSAYLEEEVRPWIEERAKSPVAHIRSAGQGRLSDFQLYTDFANKREDILVDRQNPLLAIGAKALVLGIDGDRVLKFSEDFSQPLFPTRPFDAEVYEQGPLEMVKNGVKKISGYGIQERLQKLDIKNPEHVRGLITFFKDLRDEKFGKKYVIGDFAAGLEQFGYVPTTEGGITIKAVEQMAVVPLIENTDHSFTAMMNEGLLRMHDSIIQELEALNKPDQKTE